MITAHKHCLQSAPPFLFELSSLGFSQTALISGAFGLAARSSRVQTRRRSENGRFYTNDALSVWKNLGKYFVVRLVMRL